MVFPFLAALLACLPALQAAAPPPRRLAFVIDKDDSGERGLFEALAKAYRGRAAVSLYELDDAQVSDPIAKGRLLADLETRDLVVAVGDGAADFATGEVENVPVYFVDAAVVDGRQLESPLVAGLFSYSVEDLLDAMKALRLDAFGLAFTPGYEPLAELIRRGADARGMKVFERKIAGSKDVAPAVRGLLRQAPAIWVVGDPLLARGAGFEFIRERSLSERAPIVASGRWDVEHGALLGYQATPEGQAGAAERSIDLLLRRVREEPRLSPAAGGGALLLNETLARKWDIRPAGGLRWRTLR